MKVALEIDEKDLKKLVIAEIVRLSGVKDAKVEDVEIQVKSK